MQTGVLPRRLGCRGEPAVWNSLSPWSRINKFLKVLVENSRYRFTDLNQKLASFVVGFGKRLAPVNQKLLTIWGHSMCRFGRFRLAAGGSDFESDVIADGSRRGRALWGKGGDLKCGYF